MTVRIPRFSCALKMKIWLLISLICCAYLCGVCFGVDIEPCSPAVKNDSCNITCRVLDFNQGIEFKCNGSSRGQCSIFNCPSNMIKEGQTMLHLHIPMLSYTTDNCEWTCTYGGTSSAPANIIIYSGISSSNLTSQTNADGSVHLTATADCLYPSNPSVDVEYSYQSGGQYVSLGQKVDLQSSNVPGLCSDVIESRITATFHASGDLAVLKGKNVFFRMKFLQYQSALPTYSNEVGPFYFEDCSLDIFLYGFLPDFLIVLIVSIVIIIILKIECLPKQFGGLTWKKLGIIAVCFVVAIIIGVCLGLLIKGCDNKFLALALSLLFGSLLVVALILALIYYHKKKFESRRDIQDGGAQDGNGSSQNNTGSNTTRTTTERVGSPASTSNVELAANLKSEY